MRYLAAILLSIILAISGCSKSTSSAIVGKWELRSASNGQGGITNYAAGNGNVMEFTPTMVRRYDQGRLSSSFRYTVKKVKSNISGLLIDKLIPEEDTGFSIGIEVNGRFLSLFADVYDGPTSTYEKISR